MARRIWCFYFPRRRLPGGQVAHLSIAGDESYINKPTGERFEKSKQHCVVTIQDELTEMLHKQVVSQFHREPIRASGRLPGRYASSGGNSAPSRCRPLVR